MLTLKILAAAATACASAALVSCASSSHGQPTSTRVPASSPAGHSSVPGSPTSSSQAPAPNAGNPASQAQNLPVTDDVRAQLVRAGAALNSLPANAYTGLVPGRTYYAYDKTTSTYWAGAALLPSPSSMQAQVLSQDDGSYLLFSRPADGGWTARPVGLTGTAEGKACPVTVPPEVLALWGWPPRSCRAPSG